MRSSSSFFSAASRNDVVETEFSAPSCVWSSEKGRTLEMEARMLRVDRRTDMRLLSSPWNTMRLYLAMMRDHNAHSEKSARCCRWSSWRRFSML